MFDQLEQGRQAGGPNFDGLPVVRRQDGKEKAGIFKLTYSVRQTKVAVEH